MRGNIMLLRKLLTAVCVMTVAAALPRAALASPFFAVVGWQGEFARVDAVSGVVESLPSTLPHGLQALAYSPAGVLYAGGDGGVVYEIDPFAVTARHVLTTGQDIRGMAFSPDGVLYISVRDIDPTPTALRILDLSTGAETSIGILGASGNHAQGLAFSPDGSLYAVRPNERNFELFTIDLDDAETHLVGSHLGILDQGIAFTPDGLLYAVGHSSFAQLDPINGAIIGQIIAVPGDLRGLALVPEPTTLVLLALGGLAMRRRRDPRQTERAG